MVSSIDLESLVVGYKSPVIENVNLTVNSGEIVALIGPNGAGKSTVLKTITRQIRKMDGKIVILGEDEDGISEDNLAKKLSMVTTERIHPELMSCFDVVSTGRYPYTGRLGILSKNDIEIVKQAIDMVGAGEVADKDFSKVSDGQRQRVMLARAICQEPEILILDEPTSFLDIQFKIDILSVIKNLAKEKNIAVLMSIHELEFVPAVADKVVAVSDGKVFKIGTPDEILTGENLAALYHMSLDESNMLATGLIDYSNSLKRVLCQK